MTQLPSGWVEAPLGTLASDISYGFTAKARAVGGDAQMLRITDIQDGAVDWKSVPYCDISAQDLSRYCLQDGDLLFARTGATVGKTYLVRAVPPRVVFASYLIRVRPAKRDLSRYLSHFFGSHLYWEQISDFSAGTGQPNVNGSKLREVLAPVAPEPEQQRIADKLDIVLARVDACRDRLARVAPLLKRFRQSILAAATSGRLTEDWRGDVASAWITLRAEDVCAKVQSGGTPKAGFTETTGIPFLKVYNIVDQRIDFEYRPQFVHPSIHTSELGKSRALPGDVLMNIVGPPLGKVAVLTDAAAEWNINQAITLFRPSVRITSGWLYLLLCEGAAVRSVLDRTKGSVGQVNISLSQCRAFEFPVPTVDEQNEAVRRVETLFAFADRLETRLAHAHTAVDRLTPSLLSKAFRGELVPQDPADEPAAELLARLAKSTADAEDDTNIKRPRGRPKRAA